LLHSITSRQNEHTDHKSSAAFVLSEGAIRYEVRKVKTRERMKYASLLFKRYNCDYQLKKMDAEAGCCRTWKLIDAELEEWLEAKEQSLLKQHVLASHQQFGVYKVTLF
jgi:hypothetical protein